MLHNAPAVPVVLNFKYFSFFCALFLLCWFAAWFLFSARGLGFVGCVHVWHSLCRELSFLLIFLWWQCDFIYLFIFIWSVLGGRTESFQISCRQTSAQPFKCLSCIRTQMDVKGIIWTFLNEWKSIQSGNLRSPVSKHISKHILLLLTHIQKHLLVFTIKDCFSSCIICSIIVYWLNRVLYIYTLLCKSLKHWQKYGWWAVILFYTLLLNITKKNKYIWIYVQYIRVFLVDVQYYL